MATPARQSERGAVYERALDDLRPRGLTLCVRVLARRHRGGPLSGNLPRPASARVARRGCSGKAGCRRSSGSTISGSAPQEQRPAEQCGDLLVRDRHGNWTYQFAVVVDDWLQNVNLVIRGEDLLDSTGRQIQLARLLGREHPPAFLHHELLMKTPTQKLSKSDGDTGVRDLRAKGWSAEAGHRPCHKACRARRSQLGLGTWALGIRSATGIARVLLQTDIPNPKSPNPCRSTDRASISLRSLRFLPRSTRSSDRTRE